MTRQQTGGAWGRLRLHGGEARRPASSISSVCILTLVTAQLLAAAPDVGPTLAGPGVDILELGDGQLGPELGRSEAFSGLAAVVPGEKGYGPASAARSAGAGRVAMPTLFQPFLSRKNEDRLTGDIGRSQVWFHLSDLGRLSKGFGLEELHPAAKKAVRRLLRTQLDVVKTGALDLWTEVGFGLRSRAAYRGGRRAGDDDERRPVDVDVGFTSGRPFVATTVAGARISVDRHVLSGTTALTATRHLGTGSLRLVIRRDGELRDDEVRVGYSFPLPMGPR